MTDETTAAPVETSVPAREIDPRDIRGIKRVEIKETIDELEEVLSELTRSIAIDDAGRAALVYQIEYRREHSETPQVIYPARVVGEQARDAAAREVNLIELRPDQDPRTASRLPGLLAASPGTLALARQANTIKAKLDTQIRDFSEQPYERRQAVKSVYDNRKGKGAFSRAHAQRQIFALRARPRMASFTWAGHVDSIRRITVREALDDLAKLNADEPMGDIAEETWHQMISDARVALEALPADEYIARSHQMAPHPRINLWFEDEDLAREADLDEKLDPEKIRNRQCPATLPLLYPDDGSGQVPPGRDLEAFDNERRRASRNLNKFEAQPLCTWRGLRRYRPEYRQRAPASE